MRTMYLLFVILALAAPAALTGCDRTVSEQTKTTSDSNGTVKKETKTVTEDPAGNVTVNKEESKSVPNP